MSILRSNSPDFNFDPNPIKPTSPLIKFLEKVQEIALKALGELHFDPKFYVDLSLKSNLKTTEDAFDELLKSSNGIVKVSDFEGFIEKYFESAGVDLEICEPVDFVAEPDGFLPRVENLAVREWGLKVHLLWKDLSRKVSGSVLDRPDFHTLIALPNCGIVPGSRFREVYYWDSYWVIRGLLASKMYETAKGIVINLISLIQNYGYVLNGARQYYTNRSQPPLLSAMIYEIYNRTNDLELLQNSLPALLKEYEFWNSGVHNVTIEDMQRCEHYLSRYYAMWNKPRPESSTIDKESASKLNDLEKEQFYRELASAAESGWDFSTRWMRDHEVFTTLATTSVLPVDLNVFILRMELDIAFMAKVVGENSIAERFEGASRARKEAINAVFWNENKGQWFDYWLSTNVCDIGKNERRKLEAENQNQSIFASNFVPLWIELFHSDSFLVEKVTKSLRDSGLICAAGIATSLTNSGQQWDFPNGWPPIQHMIVEGLAKSGSKEARLLAEDIAFSWIRTNYIAYKKTGAMHEKYDVQKFGEFGSGGEYIPQTGFGWSNGVVLAFLEEFGWPENQKIDFE